MKLLKNLVHRVESGFHNPDRPLSEPFETGFHGDACLLQLMNCVLQQVHAFIETGSNVGTTCRYVGETFPQLKVYSCEPDPIAFHAAAEYTKHLQNVRLFNGPSPQFLYNLHQDYPELLGGTNLYFLDAHGYGFRWPLTDEIKYLTETLDSGFILIDDFRVPGRPEFRFAHYDNQICAFETIAPYLSRDHTYLLVYPDYTERTSQHHPMIGTGLLIFGVEGFVLPTHLQDKFKITKVSYE